MNCTLTFKIAVSISIYICASKWVSSFLKIDIKYNIVVISVNCQLDQT